MQQLLEIQPDFDIIVAGLYPGPVKGLLAGWLAVLQTSKNTAAAKANSYIG
jgi:hypothetical protein